MNNSYPKDVAILFSHSDELLLRSHEAQKTANNLSQRIATLLKMSDEFCRDARVLFQRRPQIKSPWAQRDHES